MSGISSKAAGKLENRRKFNEGTELNTDFDISLYETDFRSYDPQIGRFLQIDELSEADFAWSPYVYSNNNPILLNDPTGLTSDSTITPSPPPPSNMSGKHLDEIVVVAKSKPKIVLLPEMIGPSRTTDEFEGVWGKAKWILFMGNHEGGRYNWNGKLVGQTPIMGTPPVPTFGKVDTYIKLAKLTKQLKGAIQAHHLVEVRHLKRLLLSTKNAPSVLLSKADHQEMTNTLRQLLPYGQTYTKQQIVDAYKQAYSNFPQWIDEVVKYLQ